MIRLLLIPEFLSRVGVDNPYLATFSDNWAQPLYIHYSYHDETNIHSSLILIKFFIPIGVMAFVYARMIFVLKNKAKVQPAVAQNTGK